MGKPDARGEVGTHSTATQNAPTFSRDELGAGLSIIIARNIGIFQPDGASTPRGRFDPVANDITLFRAADLSTFAHESGHAWLFQMVHDLEDARLTEMARNRIIADLRIVMDWLKVDRVMVGDHPVLTDNAVAWDANGHATHDGLMAALGREIAGDPLLTHDQRAQAARLDQPVAELRRMVIAAGLDPATVSRDDVRTLMQRKTASGKALGQPVNAGVDPNRMVQVLDITGMFDAARDKKSLMQILRPLSRPIQRGLPWQAPLNRTG